MIHTSNGLDLENLKDFIEGRISFRKCPCCDNNGKVYYDGSTGLGASSSPAGIDPEWLTWDNCDNCYGLAYVGQWN
jgi:hypothetical protein